ncbi:MAG: ferritin-like domain-containing protein [Bacillota bacterium]
MGWDYEVVEGLKAALIDERTTAEFYAALRNMSKTYDGVEAFAEARKDELDHAREITELLEELTGMTPVEATQPVRPPAFQDYCEGIRKAVAGERKAGIEYSNIMAISFYKKVNRALEEIISDEEVHLAKFTKLSEILCRDPTGYRDKAY